MIYLLSLFFPAKKQKFYRFNDGSAVMADSIKTFYRAAVNKHISLLKDKIWKYNYHGKGVILYTVDPVGPQIEVFQNDEYRFLNVKGKEVIDVGANIGDTAIYFLLNFAKRVIAIEPYPANCEIIQKNLAINSIDDGKAIILNCAIGPRNLLNISSDVINSGAQESVPSHKGTVIDVIPLSEVISKYNLENAVLKMDCEGCEYDAILNESCKTLRFFVQMQIEYHYGDSLIKEKLETCGFTVKSTPPRFVPNINVDHYMTLRGYIYASRNEYADS